MDFVGVIDFASAAIFRLKHSDAAMDAIQTSLFVLIAQSHLNQLKHSAHVLEDATFGGFDRVGDPLG